MKPTFTEVLSTFHDVSLLHDYELEQGEKFFNRMMRIAPTFLSANHGVIAGRVIRAISDGYITPVNMRTLVKNEVLWVEGRLT